MRFVSLNAWGGKLWDALAGWVPEVGADILCLQEVTRAPEPNSDWLIYEDAYRRLDQRADLFRDISALLPDHMGYFAAAARGPLWDDQRREVQSEHGIAIWVHRRLAVTELRQGFIHGQYRPKGWGAEPVPRAIQMARVMPPEAGDSFAFGHFHGLRDPSGKGQTPARAAQTQAVVSALSVFQPLDRMILAGDFNLLPDNPFFADLSGLGLTDLVTANGHTDTRTRLYKKAQRFADYTLVGAEIGVERFDLPAVPVVSDHRAMILDFHISGQDNGAKSAPEQH